MQPDYRTLKDIVREMVETPVFPLLFITETVKLAALGAPLGDVLRLAGFAILATSMWTLSDAVGVDVDDEQIDVDVNPAAVIGDSSRRRAADRGRGRGRGRGSGGSASPK